MNINLFGALAEPHRFRIVELLRERPRSVNEVAELLHVSQPQATRHMQALHKAGLVTVQPVAQQRIYSLAPEPFQELTKWLASFETHWNDRFNTLDRYFEQLKKERER